MNLNYSLNEQDFLEYLLYESSKSKSQKGRRFRSRIIIPIIYLVLGVFVGGLNGKPIMGFMFAAFGIVWFLLYPKYSKWRYRKHFQKHINENYQNRINENIELIVSDNTLSTKDFTGESNVNISELIEFIELQKHFLIKLTTGMGLIIPKESINNVDEFKREILNLGVAYVNDMDWEWK